MYAKWRIFVHQVATFAGVGVREGLGHRVGAMQDPANELPRMPIPRTSVNRRLQNVIGTFVV